MFKWLNRPTGRFPENLQPAPEEVRFDLTAALDAVVGVRAEIPEDAFTASILGTERLGNGVVIREDGLILTIGYLITEAQTIWLTTNTGGVVPGHPLGVRSGHRLRSGPTARPTAFPGAAARLDRRQRRSATTCW